VVIIFQISEMSAFAVIPFTGGDFSEDFDSLGAGPSVGLTWTNNLTLSGWYAYQSNLQGGVVLADRADGDWGQVESYERSIGHSTAGSLLNLGNSELNPNRSLGSFSSGHDFVFALVLRNDSPVTFNSIGISYFGEQWQVNSLSLRSGMVLEFSYGVFSNFSAAEENPNTVVPHPSSEPGLFMAGFTNPIDAALDVSALQTGSAVLPLDGNALTNRAYLSATLPLLWEPSEYLVLRWFDDSKIGETQAVLAINDLNLSATPIPEPNSLLMTTVTIAFLLWTRGKRGMAKAT